MFFEVADGFAGLELMDRKDADSLGKPAGRRQCGEGLRGRFRRQKRAAVIDRRSKSFLARPTSGC